MALSAGPRSYQGGLVYRLDPSSSRNTVAASWWIFIGFGHPHGDVCRLVPLEGAHVGLYKSARWAVPRMNPCANHSGVPSILEGCGSEVNPGGTTVNLMFWLGSSSWTGLAVARRHLVLGLSGTECSPLTPRSFLPPFPAEVRSRAPRHRRVRSVPRETSHGRMRGSVDRMMGHW